MPHAKDDDDLQREIDELVESAKSWLDEIGRFSIEAEHIDRLNGYAAIAEDIERRAAAVSAPVATRAAKIKTPLVLPTGHAPRLSQRHR